MRFLSATMTQGRGSIGGVTFTANQWHQLVARARTSPVNPNTLYQAMIRSCFSGAEGLYEVELPADRSAWADYAATCKKSGPLGDYYLNGRLLYLRNMTIALYLDSRGLALTDILTTPPVIPGWLDMQQVTVGPPVAVGTGFSVTIQNPAPESAFVYVMRSHAFNPTRERFKGPFDSTTLIGTTVASGAGVSHDFLGLTAGLRYFFFLRAISDIAPHRTSVRYIGSALAEVNAGP